MQSPRRGWSLILASHWPLADSHWTLTPLVIITQLPTRRIWVPQTQHIQSKTHSLLPEAAGHAPLVINHRHPDFVSFLVFLPKGLFKPCHVGIWTSLGTYDKHIISVPTQTHWIRMYPQMDHIHSKIWKCGLHHVSQLSLFPMIIVLTCIQHRGLTLKQKDVNPTANSDPADSLYLPCAALNFVIQGAALWRMVCIYISYRLKKSLLVLSVFLACILGGLWKTLRSLFFLWKRKGSRERIGIFKMRIPPV